MTGLSIPCGGRSGGHRPRGRCPRLQYARFRSPRAHVHERRHRRGLYSLDSTTGEAARVGTAEQFGISESFPLGMAWHKGELYMIGGGHAGLYKLDVITGEASLVATKDQITGSGGPRFLWALRLTRASCM